jgi:DNA invertase Pin-like site-specific DNA recombinase
MKQTVVIYTRVSTDKQTTDSQLASLREYCARHDWQDVQVIADTVSGSKISRKGLDQLMKAVRAGKVDVVLCYNLDRLGRSLSHLVQLLGEFAAHKVALIVPGQGINTSSSNPASAPASQCAWSDRALRTLDHRRACQRWTSRRTEARHQAGPSRNSRCSSRGRGQTARARTHRTRHRQRTRDAKLKRFQTHRRTLN